MSGNSYMVLVDEDKYQPTLHKTFELANDNALTLSYVESIRVYVIDKNGKEIVYDKGIKL